MSDSHDLEGRCGACLLFGAIEGLSDGLVLVDPEGFVFHLNRRAAELLESNGSRVRGMPIERLLRQPGLAVFWATGSAASGTATTEIPLASGISVRATISDCNSSDGTPIGKALLLRDISRERKIQLELSESLTRRLLELTGEREQPDPRELLTRREIEVLKQLAAGLTNAEIGDHLHVSTHTVASHLKQLYRKLGLSGRSQAAAWAVSHNIAGSV